ncbi:MAG: formylglycine-generating enzyme family protein [Ardenticatenaceae bacterium]
MSPEPNPTEVPPTATSVPPTATLPPTATAVPPTATPTLGIGSTMEGQDGMTLLYVPQGEFLRGSKENDPDAHEDGREHPQRTIYLDAFWIDQTEVTNEMFARFVDETGHQTDAEKEGTGWAFTGTSWEWIDGADWQHPRGPDSSVEGLEQHPVVQLSWNDAKAYCEWAGRRLPTEAEWEKAARGTDGRSYPWGNEDVTGNRVNLCDKNCPRSSRIDSIDDSYESTAPVGTYPDGASFYGALDMAGNVWELTADWYDVDYYKYSPERNPKGPDSGQYRAVRGGSWIDSVARRVRAPARDRGDPASRSVNHGVRCARSP